MVFFALVMGLCGWDRVGGLGRRTWKRGRKEKEDRYIFLIFFFRNGEMKDRTIFLCRKFCPQSALEQLTLLKVVVVSS